MNERTTQQKRIILGALAMADHPTANELYFALHDKYPKISKATVFRVLAHASENGTVRRIDLKGEDARYDADLRSHAHMHCLKCGRVFDLSPSQFAEILNIKQISDFAVTSCELEFTGVCGGCREKEINKED